MPRKPNYDRDELIERARDLFWKRGWAGTSLKDLEAALMMKPGSFYAAFGSKDALFKLAMEKYATDGQERLRALEQDLGPIKALQQFPEMVVGNDAAPAKACRCQSNRKRDRKQFDPALIGPVSCLLTTLSKLCQRVFE